MSENMRLNKVFSTLYAVFDRYLFAPNTGTLFLWLPVCLGFGIITAFETDLDLTLPVMIGAGGVALCTSVAGWVYSRFVRIVTLGLLMICVGYGAAQYRTHALQAPVLTDDIRSAVLGRVVWIDRSSNNHPRLKLDSLRAADLGASPPRFLMVSLIDEAAEHADALQPGQYVRLGAVIAGPPPLPAEPGAFDYRVYAQFKQIGGVGYTRAPLVVLAQSTPDAPVSIRMNRWRKQVSAHLQTVFDNTEAGAVAAALTVGDRYALSPETVETLRVSGLAHLLSISGLHIGVVTMFVFVSLRLGLCLVPRAGQRYPIKKIAAVCAVIAGGLYTLMAVPSLPTQRAFVMACVAFTAILLDRRAITLRALAVAAMILLIWQPESLLQVGFQLSFIATAGLVVVYQAYQKQKTRKRKDRSLLMKIGIFFVGIVCTSLIAGLVTAPVAAFHFNRLPTYSLLANVMAMPVFTMLVVPSSFVSAFSGLFGLHEIPLLVTKASIDFIVWVAAYCASLPEASLYIPATTSGVFALLMGCLVAALLWQGMAMRALFASGAMIAVALWLNTPRPDILVSPNARLVGVLTENGRKISSPKTQQFLAARWLERDGGPPDVEAAYQGVSDIEGGTLLQATPGRVVILGRYKKDIPALCEQADILIVREQHIEVVPESCTAKIINNPTDQTRSIYTEKAHQ